MTIKRLLVVLVFVFTMVTNNTECAPTGECQEFCNCDSLRRHMECDCRKNACKTNDTGENLISFKKQKLIYEEMRINNLEYIDTNLFWQTSVNKNTKIYLSMVNYLTRNSFNFASFIELIEITYENMMKVEQNAFNGLKCDQLVLLAANKNFGFNINIFNDTTEIRNLVLSYMNTNYLEQVFHTDAKSTDEFEVNNWSSNASIQILEILEVRCKLVLDETWAPRFRNLETIFIYRTDIKYIHTNFMRLHSKSLKHLILRENKIEDLNSNMFSGFESLVLLDLSDNPIKYIHEDAFVYLNKLQSLDLQGIFKTYQIDDTDVCTLAHLPCSVDVYLDRSLTASCALILLSVIKSNENLFMEIAPESYQALDDRRLERIHKQCDLKSQLNKCFENSPPQFDKKCLFEKYSINASSFAKKEKKIAYEDTLSQILDDNQCINRLTEHGNSTKSMRRLTKKMPRTTMNEEITTTTSTTTEVDIIRSTESFSVDPTTTPYIETTTVVSLNPKLEILKPGLNRVGLTSTTRRFGLTDKTFTTAKNLNRITTIQKFVSTIIGNRFSRPTLATTIKSFNTAPSKGTISTARFSIRPTTTKFRIASVIPSSRTTTLNKVTAKLITTIARTTPTTTMKTLPGKTTEKATTRIVTSTTRSNLIKTSIKSGMTTLPKTTSKTLGFKTTTRITTKPGNQLQTKLLKQITSISGIANSKTPYTTKLVSTTTKSDNLKQRTIQSVITQKTIKNLVSITKENTGATLFKQSTQTRDTTGKKDLTAIIKDNKDGIEGLSTSTVRTISNTQVRSRITANTQVNVLQNSTEDQNRALISTRKRRVSTFLPSMSVSSKLIIDDKLEYNTIIYDATTKFAIMAKGITTIASNQATKKRRTTSTKTGIVISLTNEPVSDDSLNLEIHSSSSLPNYSVDKVNTETPKPNGFQIISKINTKPTRNILTAKIVDVVKEDISYRTPNHINNNNYSQKTSENNISDVLRFSSTRRRRTQISSVPFEPSQAVGISNNNIAIHNINSNEATMFTRRRRITTTHDSSQINNPIISDILDDNKFIIAEYFNSTQIRIPRRKKTTIRSIVVSNEKTANGDGIHVAETILGNITTVKHEFQPFTRAKKDQDENYFGRKINEFKSEQNHSVSNRADNGQEEYYYDDENENQGVNVKTSTIVDVVNEKSSSKPSENIVNIISSSTSSIIINDASDRAHNTALTKNNQSDVLTTARLTSLNVNYTISVNTQIIENSTQKADVLVKVDELSGLSINTSINVSIKSNTFQTHSLIPIFSIKPNTANTTSTSLLLSTTRSNLSVEESVGLMSSTDSAEIVSTIGKSKIDISTYNNTSALMRPFIYTEHESSDNSNFSTKHINSSDDETILSTIIDSDHFSKSDDMVPTAVHQSKTLTDVLNYDNEISTTTFNFDEFHNQIEDRTHNENEIQSTSIISTKESDEASSNEYGTNDIYYDLSLENKITRLTTTTKIWIYYPLDDSTRSSTLKHSYLVVNEKSLESKNTDNAVASTKILFFSIIFLVLSVCCVHFFVIFIRSIRFSERFLKRRNRFAREQSGEAILLSHIRI